jgi:hypothetical protein
MKILFKTLAIFMLIAASTQLNAQIFSTKSEIINLKGTNYEKGYTNDGYEYLLYILEGTDKYGESYYYAAKYILFEIEDLEEPMCLVKEIIEPKNRVNEIVATLKKDYVELDYLKYKDYETDMIYDVSFFEIEDGSEFCLITIYHDTKE